MSEAVPIRCNGAQWVRILRTCTHTGEEQTFSAGEIVQLHPAVARDLFRARVAVKYEGDDEQ